MVVANRLGNWISTESSIAYHYFALTLVVSLDFGNSSIRGGNILFLKEASVFNSPGFNRVKRLNSSTREF